MQFYQNKLQTKPEANFDYAGLFTLALRLVVGWTYFSAFWRRLVLANKLDPEVAGYIGIKFNHFLPQALGIKGFIEYLVTHEEILWWVMVVFTIVEGIVGALFMLGIFTRIMAMAVAGLAFGILLSAGWLGTTCLDEWQIGVLGVAAGFTIFFTGGGFYALDYRIKFVFQNNLIFKVIDMGVSHLSNHRLRRFVWIGSVFILGLTLFTNQYFHGGVWGSLHNMSVKPRVEISNTHLQGDSLAFEVFRVEGADVYGSFLIGITLENEQGDTLFLQTQAELATMQKSQIENAYIAKVEPSQHSLIIPLGAKAVLKFRAPQLNKLTDSAYILKLHDISGAVWEQRIKL
ncbi:MAG: quinol oxidase [Bernardetiaceae bacterium]|nr:quinol oxidase [Bernardetiaceae bacterium]